MTLASHECPNKPPSTPEEGAAALGGLFGLGHAIRKRLVTSAFRRKDARIRAQRHELARLNEVVSALQTEGHAQRRSNRDTLRALEQRIDELRAEHAQLHAQTCSAAQAQVDALRAENTRLGGLVAAAAPPLFLVRHDDEGEDS
jgi:septal ring factor EnvC (AmiA/AmiB activator)